MHAVPPRILLECLDKSLLPRCTKPKLAVTSLDLKSTFSTGPHLMSEDVFLGGILARPISEDDIDLMDIMGQLWLTCLSNYKLYYAGSLKDTPAWFVADVCKLIPDEVMDTLRGSTYFSAIDLRSGYWQVEVEERDKEKTAFTTAHGLYEFNVMPFRLCNAPAT
ncbi:K02A2.6-like [Cordylochernes scorpioides]|uniref:K02A2.6-like n=1 Tax=Cordylochernes scorpioides TaxID=51811 RepID=A0ABY6K3I0_9ARAC|nr:K02A2.6-like [Cordylochernes scorpioides]